MSSSEKKEKKKLNGSASIRMQVVFIEKQHLNHKAISE